MVVIQVFQPILPLPVICFLQSLSGQHTLWAASNIPLTFWILLLLIGTHPVCVLFQLFSISLACPSTHWSIVLLSFFPDAVLHLKCNMSWLCPKIPPFHWVIDPFTILDSPTNHWFLPISLYIPVLVFTPTWYAYFLPALNIILCLLKVWFNSIYHVYSL